MPQQDTAVTLQTVINIAKRKYFSQLLAFLTISGMATNEMMSLHDQAVDGDGLYIKYKRSQADSFRPDRDALSGFGTSRPFVAEEIKVRFNEQNSTLHDFVKLAGSSRVSEYQIIKAEDANDAAIVDIVATLVEDFRRDFDFKRAVLRNCDRTARLATVDGTKRNNSSLDFASCSTYTNGATSCRLQVDDGAIGWFREGQYVDIYTSGGTLILDNLQVTDEPNAADMSVGLAITSETTAAANCDSIADNYELFWSGARNQGMYSIGELFATPAANYIGGTDRTSVNYRPLQGRLFRSASGTVVRKIARTDFDDVADTLATQYDKPDYGYSVRMQQRLHTALRVQFEAAAFIPWPTTEAGKSKRWANYGSSGLTYQHPALGTLSLMADPFMKPGRFQMLAFDDWMALYYKNKGLRIMPGGIAGNWERMEGDVAGQGKGMFYQMQAYANMCDFCKFPRRQVEAQNLSAT